MFFAHRAEAGRMLAEALCHYAGAEAIVLGMARGGVVVGAEVARALGLPLEAIITRKIGAPGNPEYAIGAIAEGGEAVLNHSEIRAFGISQQYLDREILYQKEEIQRRQEIYRGGRGLPSLVDKTAILVDDGIATGFTMRAAIQAVGQAGAARIVMAVPVGPAETIKAFEQLVDEVACLDTPEPFLAVGRFYYDFEQIEDEEVKKSLAEAALRIPGTTD